MNSLKQFPIAAILRVHEDATNWIFSKASVVGGASSH